MNHTRRSGFSLLEVMLATTVLLGSVMVLSQIAFVGMAHMDAAEQYAAAQLVCQSRMNEMLAGALPIEEVSGQAIPELPGWGLTVKVQSASQPGLLALEVTAAEQSAGEIAQIATEPSTESATDMASAMATEPVAEATTLSSSQATGTGKQFTLVRWIADPESSEASSPVPTPQNSGSPDVPVQPSPLDDSPLPGDSLLPEQPMPPEAPPLPEEPSMFDEPLPEL